MLRSLKRKMGINPFEKEIERRKKYSIEKILIAWNRGLGDIALGLYPMIAKIRKKIPKASITFLTRKNLAQGFSLLQEVETLIAPGWERGKPFDVRSTLLDLGISLSTFDWIIEKPDPSQWIYDERGKIVPKLFWDPKYDRSYHKFFLDKKYKYIGVQPSAETAYGHWRNWPKNRFEELFSLAEADDSIRFLLFGYDKNMQFNRPNIIDLRGKTSLFELLSIVKNCCQATILPDSGILSMIYYLNTPFALTLISLWADKNNGILKQAVPSPNHLLKHIPMITEKRDLKMLTAKEVYEQCLLSEKKSIRF